jgi:hypothetical protein
MQIPSSLMQIIGLIVLALVLVFLFANIVMPLLKTLS